MEIPRHNQTLIAREVVRNVLNGSERYLRSPVAAALVITLVATLVCIPFLAVGVPSAAFDAETHAVYQYYFSHQFWGGEVFPRWLAGHNKGYGSPVFVIQYPFPYFLTALLRPILSFAPTATREAHELGVYCYLVVLGSGLSAWFWFRHRCSSAAAVMASLIYILLPFILGQALYRRAAVGELTSFVWMPLLLALCDRVYPVRLHVVVAIGAAFALLVLSNILNALMFLPIIILYALVSDRRSLLPTALGLGFGVVAAAFYLLPFAAYMKSFDGSGFLNHPQFELGRNLLQVSWADLHDQHMFGVSVLLITAGLAAIALWGTTKGGKGVDRVIMLLTLGLGSALLIPGIGPALVSLTGLKVSGFDSSDAYSMKLLSTSVLTAALGMIAYCSIVGRKMMHVERFLFLASCVVFVLMTPWSALLWRVVPGLSVIQFPWRLCAVLTVLAAGLVASAIDECLRDVRDDGRKALLVPIISFAFAVIVAGAFVWRDDVPWRRFSAPQIVAERQVDMAYVTYVPRRNLAAFARLVGTSPDTYDVAPTSAEEGVRTEFVAGKGVVSVRRQSPRRLLVSVKNDENARLQIGQLYFPLWKLVPEEGSQHGPRLEVSPENLIQVSLPPGEHSFELVFDGGLPERIGVLISLASIAAALAGLSFAGARSGMIWRKYRTGNGAYSHSAGAPRADDALQRRIVSASD